MRVVYPEQMREMDRQTIEAIGVPGIVLMEHASIGGVAAILARVSDEALRRVGVLCGGGNNGGDGFAMARLLAQRGIAVEIAMMAPPERLSADAAVNHRVAVNLGIPTHALYGDDAVGWDALPDCTLWLDALLGTGLDRVVTGRYAEAVAFLNEQPLVVAVDTPSGLDCRTGAPLGCCVQAAFTVSFGAAKLGQALDPGRGCCGELVVVDIGIPASVMDTVGHAAAWLTPAWGAGRLARRALDAHKGDVGKVLVVGGAAGMSGAAALCARAAITSGAGLVTAACAPETATIIPTIAPEVMSAPVLQEGGPELALLERLWRRVDTLVLGPGLGTDATALAVLRDVLGRDPGARRFVLDADALNLVAGHDDLRALLRALPAPVVLTPHPGEMARLCQCSIDEITSAPITHAQHLARALDCVVVLKLGATVIAAPDGRLAINATGNPGMASAGMGDVLAGVMAAALAEHVAPFEAACVAVHAHGAAGDLARDDRGERGVTASAVTAALPAALARMERA